MSFTSKEWDTINNFRRLCDEKKLWRIMQWRGYDSAKTPEDMWLYQETLTELRPSLIIEFGSSRGGTALFYADMLDLLRVPDGRVLSIDIQSRPNMPVHDRLTFFVGHSRHEPAIAAVKDAVAKARGPVLIIEDSEHTEQHIVGGLELYADMVTVGSYYVVEDLGYPDLQSPARIGVDAFLKRNPKFKVDQTKDRYLVSVANGGWLKRVK